MSNHTRWQAVFLYEAYLNLRNYRVRMDNCYYHSSKSAEYTCKDCHKDFCTACIILVEGEPYCQMCWDGYVEQVRIPLVTKNLLEEESNIPWSKWRENGLFSSFWDTFNQISFQPKRFFENIPTSSTNFSLPFWFAVICVVLFWIPMYFISIEYLYPAVIQTLSSMQADQKLAGNLQSLPMNLDQMNTQIKDISRFDLLALPLDRLFSYIILASIVQHWLVFMFNGQKGFIATFQIRCYAMAAQVLSVIPFFGIILAEVVTILLCVRGFQVVRLPVAQANRLTPARLRTQTRCTIRRMPTRTGPSPGRKSRTII